VHKQITPFTSISKVVSTSKTHARDDFRRISY